MKVVKNNKEVAYNRNKIRNAIIQAFNQVKYPDFKEVDILTDEVEEMLDTYCYENKTDTVPIEEISNLIMSVLFRDAPAAAREFSSYKIKKEKAYSNPNEIEKVLFVSPEIAMENGNKDPHLSHITNAYLAEIPAKEFMREQLPKDCLDAHDRGVVYFHDMAYSGRPLHNCDLLNLEELFKGCEINGIWIETPKSFKTACTVATQILTHATSEQYGGITVNLLHLAKFVEVSRAKIKKKYDAYPLSTELKERMVQDELNTEIKDGMQTFLFQNNTLCAGTGQAVFLSVSTWLNEDPEYTDDLILVFKEFIKQRIQGIKQKDGTYLNPNFPKILYFLDEDTMRGGKYYDITKLCAECSAKRLVPDYLSAKIHRELKGVPTPPMGCRSLLHPYQKPDGSYELWGRWNMGVQSLNLPYIAMENNPDRKEEILFANLDYYLDIAHRDMLWRANHIAKIKAGQSPLLWVYGGLTRLNPEDTLEKEVYSGRPSISLGYAGLYECVKYITGESQFEENGNKLAHKILDYLNASNAKFKENTGLAAGLYGTPMETLVDNFAKACIRDFGHVGDFSDRTFITNSYHYLVSEPVDAFTKLTNEAQFSNKTTSGSISYVEVPNMSNNIEGMLELIEHIGNECLYAEINSEVSCCKSCGFEGYDFTKITATDGTVRWKCPCCGETDPKKVRTSYRICGYISNYTPNEARSADIMGRVKHLN